MRAENIQAHQLQRSLAPPGQHGIARLQVFTPFSGRRLLGVKKVAKLAAIPLPLGKSALQVALSSSTVAGWPISCKACSSSGPRLVENSTLAPRFQPLFFLLCQAERCLDYFCLEESSFTKVDKAQSLKMAMEMRNVFEIRRCLASLLDDDDSNGGDSPGSGVPSRPRQPNLPADEKRDWPHSPPPI